MACSCVLFKAPMGLIALPWDGLVIVLCLLGPCAWPMVRVFKGGLEREPSGTGRVFKGLKATIAYGVCVYVCVGLMVWVCMSVCLSVPVK